MAIDKKNKCKMSNVMANEGINYLFKVTVMAKTAVKIDDLGGITLQSGETIDLGKKFPLEKIQISRSLAEHIWEGNLWAWDSCGNQVGGWDLCDVEENLAQSCEHESKDITIVKCMEGCETDVVSDFVALQLDQHGELALTNVYQDRGVSSLSPAGTLWSSEWNDLTLHGLRTKKWVSLQDLLKANEWKPSDIVGNNLLMVDQKTERYYKFRFVEAKLDSEENPVICYIRELIKDALVEKCEDRNEVLFSSSIPDVCDTYLFKDGISGNLTPYLTTNGQALCGIKLSYQSSIVREGKALAVELPEAYSSYVLNVVVNDNRSFQISLPGGKNTGSYLDICNITPWDLVEFFEGKSKYWVELYETYRKFLDQKEKTYEVLKERGCILGFRSNEEGNIGDLPKKPINKIAFNVDSKIMAKQEAQASKLEAEFGGVFAEAKGSGYSLFLTGNKFYDTILRVVYQLKKFAFVHGDKVSVFISCIDDVRARQIEAIADNSPVSYCQNLTNVNATLMFVNYCEFDPIDGIDGRIWGTISNETGAAIEGALVTITDENEDEYETNTDSNGAYIFANLNFGRYNWTVDAKGFESASIDLIYLTPQEPSCEGSAVLNVGAPDLSADVTGYIYDQNGNPIHDAYVQLSSEAMGVRQSTRTNEDGYYQFIDSLTKNNDGKTYEVNLYAEAKDYADDKKTLTFNGTDDLSWNFNLARLYSYNVTVTGKDLDTATYSAIGAYVRLKDSNGSVIAESYVTKESNTASFSFVSGNYTVDVYADYDSIWSPLNNTFNLSSDTNFSAQLNRLQYTFASVAGDGGSISGTVNGNYEAETPWQLTANPSDGYVFTGWTSDSGGSSDSATLSGVMYEDVTWTATFGAV